MAVSKYCNPHNSYIFELPLQPADMAQPMANRTIIFLMLVIVRALHSVEEYSGRLWEVLRPAKLVSSVVAENTGTGFLIINIGLFIFDMGCWFFLLRRNTAFARGVFWFWIIIELINGAGRPVWPLYEGRLCSRPGYGTRSACAASLFMPAAFILMANNFAKIICD